MCVLPSAMCILSRTETVNQVVFWTRQNCYQNKKYKHAFRIDGISRTQTCLFFKVQHRCDTSNSMHLLNLGHLPMSKTSKNVSRNKQLEHYTVMSLSTRGYEAEISPGSVEAWQEALNKYAVCWLKGTIRMIKWVPNRINIVPLPLHCTDLAPCNY
jgi:hypothetical protein